MEAKKGTEATTASELPQKKTMAFSVYDATYSSPNRNEKESFGGQYILWGEDNRYPNELQELYTHCSILHALIDTSIEYIIGDGIVNNTGLSNSENETGDTVEEAVKKCVADYKKFGGLAAMYTFDSFGNVTTISYLNIQFCRIDKKKEYVTVFPVNESIFGSAGIQYPVFNPDTAGSEGNEVQVLFFTGEKPSGYYPNPSWEAAIIDAENLVCISRSHYASIMNGFRPSGILTLPSNVTEPERKEVERDLKEKYGGVENTSRIIVVFGDEISYTGIADDGFDAKFQAVFNTSKNSLFIAFRMPPVISGDFINTGFNTQEYVEASTLYNRTSAKPAQDTLSKVLSKPFGKDDAITFKPFTLTLADVDGDSVKSESVMAELNNAPQLLNDLTTNERRKLLGYEPIQDDEADKTILAERLGVGGTEALVSVIANAELTEVTKRGILHEVFGLSDEQVNGIFRANSNDNTTVT